MTRPGIPGRTVTVSMRAFVAAVVAALAVGGLITALGFMLGGERSPVPSVQRESGSPPAAPERVVSSYESVIRPLFDSKCAQCHGEKKQKSGLSLATTDSILAGGKHGPPIDRATPERSLMLARIRLALDEDKHMPPDDEDQLTPEELSALQRWILAGAPFEGVVADIAVPLPIPAAPAPVVASANEPARIPEADPAALEALRAALVHVQPVSEGSPLLWVDFSATAKSIDDEQARSLLAPLAGQLADVSLARTKAGDETLALLAKFPHLSRIDARATTIGDAGLAALAQHAELAELVLSQNRLTDASVDSLLALPKLERVHLWRSGLSAEALARLRAARPKLAVDDGAESPSAALEAETEIVLTKATPAPAAPPASAPAPSLAPINTKCPVSGSPVKPQFSIVHEGRVIGFCCPNCPKEFWADPSKFLDRLN